MKSTKQEKLAKTLDDYRNNRDTNDPDELARRRKRKEHTEKWLKQQEEKRNEYLALASAHSSKGFGEKGFNGMDHWPLEFEFYSHSMFAEDGLGNWLRITILEPDDDSTHERWEEEEFKLCRNIVHLLGELFGYQGVFNVFIEINDYRDIQFLTDGQYNGHVALMDYVMASKKATPLHEILTYK